MTKSGVNTHGKEDIHYIHDAKDQICNLCLMVPVTCENEYSSHNVMGEHLPMILSPFFHVDDHDLLDPKSILNQDVKLCKPSDFSLRPIRPEISHIEPVIGGDKNVLSYLSAKKLYHCL